MNTPSKPSYCSHPPLLLSSNFYCPPGTKLHDVHTTDHARRQSVVKTDPYILRFDPVPYWMSCYNFKAGFTGNCPRAWIMCHRYIWANAGHEDDAPLVTAINDSGLNDALGDLHDFHDGAILLGFALYKIQVFSIMMGMATLSLSLCGGKSVGVTGFRNSGYTPASSGSTVQSALRHNNCYMIICTVSHMLILQQ